MEQLKRFQHLLPERKGQHLALAVFFCARFARQRLGETRVDLCRVTCRRATEFELGSDPLLLPSLPENHARGGPLQNAQPTSGQVHSSQQGNGLIIFHVGVRCPANSAHIGQSRPDFGFGFHVKVLKNLSSCPLFGRKR